jgi:UDPglucose 6-dehydrogenase
VLANAGHKVLGLDVDPERVKTYRLGVVQFYKPGLVDLITEAVDRGNLEIRQNGEVCGPLGEVVLIATGTPTSPSGAADLSQVKPALSLVKRSDSVGAVVVMKSTVQPGTGTRLYRQALRGMRLKYVANPEFLREGQNPSRFLFDEQNAVDSRQAQSMGFQYQGVGRAGALDPRSFPRETVPGR